MRWPRFVLSHAAQCLFAAPQNRVQRSVTATASPPKSADYRPVAIATLRKAANFTFDLYLLPEEKKRPKLYREKNVDCTPSDFDRLVSAGVTTLCIAADMLGAYREHLKRHVLNDESIPLGNRFALLKEAARKTFLEAMHNADTDGIAAIATDMGQQLASLLNRNDLLLGDMVGVMLHDYSTYTHMTHVSTYSVLLARQMGIADTQQLAEIGAGGLLHDIGKRFISSEILTKPGKLDADEWQLVRDHPRCGFSQLCMRNDLSWGALMMVYQHHERCGGGGYPVGSVGEEIHPWAKICSIADVFDAMTSRRSYHDAAARADVLRQLQEQAGAIFDKEMVQCWTAMVENSVRSN
jgi:HD-GYP domain-containing protein (c-di-GMP phosphodiesterase class II)